VFFQADRTPGTMTRVECRDCVHFREAPYAAPRTGCWHPDNMKQRQTDAFLKEQEIPGDHEKINLRGDCPRFERRPRKRSFWRRLMAREF
jgi:hypothetical protein